ncbi:MlaD family protein [Gordonia sp. VNK21]|uniref:MlaD family protein n=1 Tax=Gordonia sp. VNK21 TaxID=3382483 RepID=UPI0038D50324
MAAAAVLVAPLSACGVDVVSGVSSIGAAGTGQDAYSITALIPSAAGLVKNAPVMMTDATVGSVGDIKVENWKAKITLRLDKGVKVPVGSHAMIGMTSVLGSSHVAIVPPEHPDGKFVTAGGALELPDCPEQENIAVPDKDPVPDITSSQQVDPCRYPTTEQVLSSLSVVLNGGGLSQAGSVVTELNKVFGGREDVLKDLLPRLTTFVDDLDEQTDNIIAAMNGLDRLAASINAQQPTVERALADSPQILQLMVDQRENLVNALGAVGQLSDTANQVLRKNRDDIETIVPNVRALLSQLATTGPALMNSLRVLLTFPFVQDKIDGLVRGDYVNSDLVLDLTVDRLNKTFMQGAGLTGPEGLLGISAGAARKTSDPFAAPFEQPGSDGSGKKPSQKNPSQKETGQKKSSPATSPRKTSPGSSAKKPASTTGTRGGN